MSCLLDFLMTKVSSFVPVLTMVLVAMPHSMDAMDALSLGNILNMRMSLMVKISMQLNVVTDQ